MLSKLGVWGMAGVVSLTLAMAAVVGSADPAAQAVPQIKQEPCVAITSVDGRDNYMAYCAVCHGVDARGRGPAAPALKMPVPDLTAMARRHGKFDAIAVERMISGVDKVTPAHGSVEMPMWGSVFRGGTTDRAVPTLRLQNLVKYLQTLQTT